MNDYSSEWASGSIDPDTMEVKKKVKVKFEKFVRQVIEKEIYLPIYAKQMRNTYGSYYLFKIDEHQTCWMITIIDHEFSALTMHKNYIFDDEQFFLKDGMFKIPKEEFEQGLKEAKKVVRGLKA